MIGDCAPAPQGQQGHIISPSALANKNSFCMPRRQGRALRASKPTIAVAALAARRGSL
jgi:hypothetical protein